MLNESCAGKRTSNLQKLKWLNYAKGYEKVRSKEFEKVIEINLTSH
jgi:hypothetical protein